MTIEHPMIPTTSRRSFLQSATGVAAAAVSLSLTPPTPVSADLAPIHLAETPDTGLPPLPEAPDADPVFGVIVRYRNASAAHTAALKEQNLSDGTGRFYEPACVACDEHNSAFWALIETGPTTFRGVIALLDFLNELAADEDDSFMLAMDGGAVVVPLIANLAQALPRLAVSA